MILTPNPVSYEIKNRFIVVEGIDGSGKTSFIRALDRHLATCKVSKQSKQQHLSLGQVLSQPDTELWIAHQPGGTHLADQIRQLFKHPIAPLEPLVGQALIEAARLDLLIKLDKAKQSGNKDWIICDRHVDSTYAYQIPEGIEREIIDASHKIYDRFIKPDLTIFLSIEPALAKKRIGLRHSGSKDRFDEKSLGSFTLTETIYENNINRNRDHYFVVDASKTEQEVFDFILSNLKLTGDIYGSD